MYSSVGSPGASRTTWASQIFSNSVREGMGADEVYNEPAYMKRRAVLRVLGLGGLASLLVACQVQLPPTPAPTEPPPPTALPTAAPAEIAALSGIRLAIDQDPDTLDPAGQTNPTASSIVEHLAETLVVRLPDGKIGPGLARKF